MLEGINQWFGANAKRISWIAVLVIAIYVIAVGIGGLV